jgi:hypothetical protein
MISLPKDKYLQWSSDISRLSSSSKVKHKSLESMIGHLNHVAGICHPMRHSLGRLYQAQYRASKNRWTRLTMNEKMDLHLLVSFLQSAFEGISMNNLTFWKLTHLYRSDASEFGLGGYNIISGQAWHFQIPEYTFNLLLLLSSCNNLNKARLFKLSSKYFQTCHKMYHQTESNTSDKGKKKL